MADMNAVLALNSADAQYDDNAKMLLAQKPFLANILVYCVEGYRGMNPKDVEKLIEDDIMISETPTEPGFTNEKDDDGNVVIMGMNSENKVVNEGIVFFDILFYARKSDRRTRIIVNIEIQKETPSKYNTSLLAGYYRQEPLER